MKAILAVTCFAILTGSAEPSKGIALANGLSPDKKFEVVLEAEKGTAAYDAYEFKGEAKEFPAFLIRDSKSEKVLTRVRWEGDANSDDQPLSSHSGVSWNPAGTVVILSTRARNYSGSSIWAFDQATGGFKELNLPDYKTMTGYEAPDSDDLHARVHSSTVWTKDGDLVYKLVLDSRKPEEGGDPLRHKTTLRLGKEGFEVIKREIFQNWSDQAAPSDGENTPK
jgi:hypothetical protein